MDWTYFLPCLWAFLACLGFSLMMNVRTFKGLMLCCVGGALGWFVYLVVMLICQDDLISCLVAAMAISLYSEIMARIRRCPVTGYLLVSLFPLVPGAGIYYTMLYMLQGDMELAFQKGMHTLGSACCLALGVLFVSTAVRVVTFLRKRKGVRR